MHISTFKTILRLKQAVVLIGVQKSLTWEHENNVIIMGKIQILIGYIINFPNHSEYEGTILDWCAVVGQ